MLGFRSDFGVSGFLDPEVGELLVQLILTEGSAAECQSARLKAVSVLSLEELVGWSMLESISNEDAMLLPFFHSLRFASDPDRVGAEKLSMTAVPKAYLDAEYVELPAVIGSA